MPAASFPILDTEFDSIYERLASMAGFSGLTFAVEPVVVAGALNTSGLPATTLIAGIVDPTSTQRIFNPVAEGNPVASGDTAAHWLPAVKTGGLFAATVTDYIKDPTGDTTDVGQVTLELTPAAANTVEAPSVMTFKLSPQALIITATGTF
jgi:hypothetical protein